MDGGVELDEILRSGMAQAGCNIALAFVDGGKGFPFLF